MKRIKKVVFLILIFIFLLQLGFRMFSYSSEYVTRFDSKYWKMRYEKSQWVVPGSKNSIGDDGLYAYVGWEYIHGSNPVLLNAEIPPLGKYIIGVGEIIFQNQNVLILLIGLSCLVVFYFLNLQIFKDKLFAFIPVFLLSLDNIFYSQLRAPYLDTMYLLFLLLTLLCMTKRNYFFACLFLGCFAAIKYPVGSLFLMAPLLAWVILCDLKHLRQFLFSLVLWPGVFLATYIMYFLRGGTVLGFLGVQKWIVHFYATGVKAVPGIVYPIILFGKWNTWFAGSQKVAEWSVLWAVSFIAAFFASFPISLLYVAHRRNKKIKLSYYDQNILLIVLWIFSYLVFLTFTPVFPRYLLLLVPFMYNLTVWFLVKYVFQRFS